MFTKNAAYYKHLIDIHEIDFKRFEIACKKVEHLVPEFYIRFYHFMETDPLFSTYYSSDVINGIKSSEAGFWEDVAVIVLNEEYISRQRIYGQTFASIGVPCEAYIAAVIYFRSILKDAFIEAGLYDTDLATSMGKITNFASIVIIDTYTEAANKVMMEQNQALMEMSTPVTQLWDGILLLPLVGFIDSKRAQETMSAMLEMIGKTQAKVFILDISGVAVVDTAVANYFIKITKASKLMGCTCMISGISGAVAQTIVELGIQIEEVTTTGNMKEALNLALGATGAKVVYLEEK